MFWIFLLLLPFLPLSSQEKRHANLSFSRQTIRILPKLLFSREIEPVDQIIFLHIPKTGGTNLRYIALGMSHNQKNFHYQRLRVPRVSNRSPNLITPDWIGGLLPLEENPNFLDTLPSSFFLAGHFPYGIHHYFASPSKYVTLIRHPLEREVSSANFDYQRNYIQLEECESYLLETMIDNPQVRMIAGKEFMQGPCTEETFAKAQENIERDFLLAAPFEEIDCLIAALATIQNWNHLAYAPMQITREKAIKELSPTLKEALLQKHAWDAKFYAWIKARWNAWKEQMILGNKNLSPEEPVLTLMPDYLETQTTQFLTIKAIELHNQEYSEEDLLELVHK